MAGRLRGGGSRPLQLARAFTGGGLKCLLAARAGPAHEAMLRSLGGALRGFRQGRTHGDGGGDSNDLIDE
jgi:hypothetical protein